MKMKKLPVVLLFVLAYFTNAEAQLSFVEMSENLEVPQLPDSLREQGAVYLDLDISLDFRYDESGLVVYTTEHKRVLINDEEAIDRFNTYYVSDDVIEWVKIEARTIASDGEVVNFDKSSIKEIVDEDSGEKYKAFAVDGVKEGDIIEFLTIKKEETSSFGQAILQKSLPVLSAKYAISCPENLQYVMKPYNASGVLYHEELVDSVRYYSMQLKDIAVYKSEDFSYDKPNKARIEFRLEKNSVKGQYSLNTWDKAASNVYGFIYDINAKEEKAIHALISDMGTPTADEAFVKELENKLKREILVKESVGADYNDITFLLDEKIASNRGIVKVYANVFRALGIEHSVLLTCSRQDYKFDKDFHNWNRLDKYLIYLPEYDKYIVPSWSNVRFGNAPSSLSAQYALFVEPVTIGDFKSGIADIRYIREGSAAENFDHIYAVMTMSDDFETLDIRMERAFSGDAGAYYTFMLERMNEADKNSLLKDVSVLNGFLPDFKEIKVLSESTYETAETADFVFQCEATVSDFIEMANDNVLVKIGNAIGPQSELYSSEKRVHDVENNYNRNYYRELLFNVPSGYVVSNPKSAEFAIYGIEEKDTICAFVSTVVYEGSTYKVTIDEYYNEIYSKKESYASFREVVNAAADFNKVMLILKPE